MSNGFTAVSDICCRLSVYVFKGTVPLDFLPPFFGILTHQYSIVTLLICTSFWNMVSISQRYLHGIKSAWCPRSRKKKLATFHGFYSCVIETETDVLYDTAESDALYVKTRFF